MGYDKHKFGIEKHLTRTVDWQLLENKHLKLISGNLL